MDKNVEKAFDFAADTSKTMIQLATGVVALGITFNKDVLNNNAPRPDRFVAFFAWGLLLMSVAFGLWTMMSLTGSLRQNKSPDVYGLNICVPATLQILFFVIGLLMVIVFGYLSF